MKRAIWASKKRAKGMADLKECDLVLLVIDPDTQDFATENEILAKPASWISKSW